MTKFSNETSSSVRPVYVLRLQPGSCLFGSGQGFAQAGASRQYSAVVFYWKIYTIVNFANYTRAFVVIIVVVYMDVTCVLLDGCPWRKFWTNKDNNNKQSTQSKEICCWCWQKAQFPLYLCIPNSTFNNKQLE